MNTSVALLGVTAKALPGSVLAMVLAMLTAAAGLTTLRPAALEWMPSVTARLAVDVASKVATSEAVGMALVQLVMVFQSALVAPDQVCGAACEITGIPAARKKVARDTWRREAANGDSFFGFMG